MEGRCGVEERAAFCRLDGRFDQSTLPRNVALGNGDCVQESRKTLIPNNRSSFCPWLPGDEEEQE